MLSRSALVSVSFPTPGRSPVDCKHPSHFDSCVASAGLRTMRHDVQVLNWQQAVVLFVENSVTSQIRNALILRSSQERRLIKLILQSLMLVPILLMICKFNTMKIPKLRSIKMLLFKLAEFSIHLSYPPKVSSGTMPQKLSILYAQLQSIFAIFLTLKDFSLKSNYPSSCRCLTSAELLHRLKNANAKCALRSRIKQL